MSGRKTFVGGDILLASEINGFLMDQAVMVFDDASARDTAIPSPSEGMVVYLKDTNQILKYVTAWVAVNTGFTASQTITATDATWPVPTLASPIVKVTVIGGGGGGGSADGTTSGGTGGTTTFDAGGAGTVTAAGGVGGSRAATAVNVAGSVGSAGNASGNGGAPGAQDRTVTAVGGRGGLITVAYLDLTGVSTVNVTIGLGGTGGAGGTPGGAGGRGEVIVEYVAG